MRVALHAWRMAPLEGRALGGGDRWIIAQLKIVKIGIRNVEAKSIDATGEPEVDRIQNRRGDIAALCRLSLGCSR